MRVSKIPQPHPSAEQLRLRAEAIDRNVCTQLRKKQVTGSRRLGAGWCPAVQASGLRRPQILKPGEKESSAAPAPPFAASQSRADGLGLTWRLASVISKPPRSARIAKPSLRGFVEWGGGSAAFPRIRRPLKLPGAREPEGGGNHARASLHQFAGAGELRATPDSPGKVPQVPAASGLCGPLRPGCRFGRRSRAPGG